MQIVIIILLVGLALQLCLGPVVWSAFRWPVNGITMAVFLTIITVIFLLRKKSRVCQFIGSSQAAIPALAFAVLLTIIMGLTPQVGLTPSPSLKGEGGGWINNMLSFWPFVLIYVYIAIILGVVVLRQLKSWAAANFSLFVFHYSLLFHLGLFLVMTTATLGYADVQQLKMITIRGEQEWRALTPQHQVVEMPFTVKLNDFVMETYDNGMPKRFASDLIITPRNNSTRPDQLPQSTPVQATVEVNKTVDVDGWKIYQFGYDTQMGPQSQTSILELISDPWLPLVYTGIYMMLGGAVLMMLRSIPWKGSVRQVRKHPKTSLVLCVLLGVCFFCVHHFMPILHSDTLVPALQSPWFRPHIIAYMMAYSLMGAATVISLYQLLSGKGEVPSNLLSIVLVGLSLITFGMLFGALWAKEAWGHYWSWDPKETWAAITWFAYLVFVHYRHVPSYRPRRALWMLIVSFALLQMCWWGIKFLPSAQAASVHVYS